jgi:hypothetical protein
VKTRTAARLGWVIWATALVLATLICLFAWLSSRAAGSVWGDQRWLFLAGTTLLFCVPGGLIVTHRPANPIGWLLCVIGLIAGVSGAAGATANMAWTLRAGFSRCGLPVSWGC